MRNYNSPAMPSTVLSEFLLNLQFLQNLVLEAAARPPTGNAANRHYNIRRCLRHIQGLLAHGDFDLSAIYIDGTNFDGDGLGGGRCSSPAENPSNNTDDGRHDDDDTRMNYYTQVTDDLMALLTLDFEAAVGDDPSILQLVREALVPRILALLQTAPSLTRPQLHALLHRILLLIERTDTFPEDADSSDPGEREKSPNQAGIGRLLPLIELFNRHVTNHEHLHMVLVNDQELFVGLHVVLQYHQEVKNNKRPPASIPSPPPLALAILINSLIECLTFHLLPVSSGGEGSARDTVSHGRNDPDALVCDDDHREDLISWLQRRFLQEQQNIESPSILQGAVDAYVASMEQYGTELIESTVRLLEDASSSSSSISATSTVASRCNQDVEDQHVTILKYAMLATNFLVAMCSISFPLLQGGTSSAFAMSRSLWQEYINFLIHSLPNHHTKAVGRDNREMSATVNGSASVDTVPQPDSSEEELHVDVAATDTLWRLAQLHYPIRSTSHTSSPGKKEDTPLITATILRLWKHAYHYWNENTVNWIRYQLGYCFPSSSSTGKDLRHSLQAIILSYVYFPNHSVGADYPKEPVETLMELVLQEENGPASPNNGAKRADPWKGWVLEQLSNNRGSFVTPPSSSQVPDGISQEMSRTGGIRR